MTLNGVWMRQPNVAKTLFWVVCMSCIFKWGTIFTCWSQLEYFWKKENGNWFSFGWAAWRTAKTMKSISKNRSTIPSIIPIMWFQLEVQVEQMCSETCSAKKCQNIEKTKQSHCSNCQLLPLSFLGQDRSSVFLIDEVVKRRVTFRCQEFHSMFYFVWAKWMKRRWIGQNDPK